MTTGKILGILHVHTVSQQRHRPDVEKLQPSQDPEPRGTPTASR